MKVWVFFYGSYMNFEVLAEVDFVPEQYEVGMLSGFEILIQPLANLVRSEKGIVYGILAMATHAELDRLYLHAQQVLGGRYFAEAVLVQVQNGTWRPALCYVAPHMERRPARNDYIDRIVAAARHFNFPQWYIERLQSFRSQ